LAIPPDEAVRMDRAAADLKRMFVGDEPGRG